MMSFYMLCRAEGQPKRQCVNLHCHYAFIADARHHTYYACQQICNFAVLWTPQSEDQAIDVAASRISCIVFALVIMAVLAIAIYPSIASELVSLQCSSLQCSRLHGHKYSCIRRG